MDELVYSLLIAIIAAAVWQTIVFAANLKLRRIDVIDVGWGLSFIVIAIAVSIAQQSTGVVGWWVLLMVTVWGLRLSLHIGKRFVRSNQQDPRYTNLVKNYSSANKNVQVYARVFMVQALLAVMVSLPVIVLLTYTPQVQFVVALGVSVWCAGLLIEAIADRQLAKFLQSAKKDQLMTSGLWRYSRHPNYFGEALLWWGIAIMTLATSYWWVGAIGALTITLLLRFVSGVPPAEARAASKTGWKDYKAKTPPFVPWFVCSIRHHR